ILIVNGHGGNEHWLGFFCQLQLARQRGYAVYVSPTGLMEKKIGEQIASRRKTDWGGHGDEVETSWM
ncbi:MAG: creatininase family protein, partial [Gemmatimonadales bacterium]|nr:creatininase family protein [Gemmatimonadales bacterium]